MNYRTIAGHIFLAGVSSVLPGKLISGTMRLKDSWLEIVDLKISLKETENIYVIGAGKASAMMGAEAEKIIGNRITEGHIIVKYGYSLKLNNINVWEAGHPLPDSNGFRATVRILETVEKAGADDLVICLLSGGGSALLCDYPDGTSPGELISLYNLLVNSGATISEMNAVRKHLSEVKGGQLARSVYPATLVSLILSDVPGDPLDVIASGPTTPDPTTFRDALSVLEKYNLTQSCSEAIMKYLQEGVRGTRPETPKPGDAIFKKTYNYIIGNNQLALDSAKKKALEYNIEALIISNQLQGDTTTIAEYIVETSLKFKTDISWEKPVCLLFGGETTVKMTGKGLGGRNQHLALLCALLLRNHSGITVLSAGTDGTDGPCDAAGAVVDSDTIPDATILKIDAEQYLREFDSYHFFEIAGGHIITGPTMTNVMDIIIVIIA